MLLRLEQEEIWQSSMLSKVQIRRELENLEENLNVKQRLIWGNFPVFLREKIFLILLYRWQSRLGVLKIAKSSFLNVGLHKKKKSFK